MSEKYKHVKRGTEYEVLFDDVEFQCSTSLKEGESLTVYRSLKDGKLWGRPFHEFHDENRFQKLVNSK